MELKLHIQDDEGRTTIVPIIREEISIGRKEGNTIRLTEQNVSRTHARLLKSNGHIYIEDAGSSYGTRLNGVQISGRTPVSLGDQIQIGDYLLAVHTEDEEAARAAARANQSTKPSAPTPVLPGNPMASVPTMPSQRPRGFDDRGGGGTAIVQLDMAQIDTDTSTARPLEPHEQARLVGLNSGFEGREIVLTRSEFIIGRTDDNDAMVDHRSISRNHAKFALEGGTFLVYDLRSSNGVKVNGERYGKVEVRAGDIVELGHVKMRFVGPGERFVYRAQDWADTPSSIDEPGPSSSKKYIFFVAGLAIVAVGLIAVFIWLRMPVEVKKQEPNERVRKVTKDKPPTPTPTPKQPENKLPTPTPTPKQPENKLPTPTPTPKQPENKLPTPTPTPKQPENKLPTPTPTPKQPDSNQMAKVTALLQEAKVLRQELKPAAAKKKVQAALKLAPDHADGKTLLADIEKDLEVDKELKQIQALSKQQKYRSAWKKVNDRLATLSPSSPYLSKFSEAKISIREEYIGDLVARAKKAAQKNKHEAVIRLTKEILTESPDNQTAKTLLAKAKKDKKAHQDKIEAEKKKKLESKKKSGNAAELYKKGKMAMINGKFNEALKLYQDCLKANPGFASAHKQLGIIYGSRGNKAAALKHYKTYLRLRPNAKDADAVKLVIRKMGG